MKIIKVLEKILSVISIIGGIVLISLMLLVVADILLRQMGVPLSGSTEIVVSLLVMIVFFGVGYCALQEMHIRVDIITACPNLYRFHQSPDVSRLCVNRRAVLQNGDQNL